MSNTWAAQHTTEATGASADLEVPMAVFFFKLSRNDNTHRLVATCTVVGEEHGYETRQREFDDESQVVKALSKAGIAKDRLDSIPADLKRDWSCAFEISHNEAQKLDVLHVDSTE